MTDLQALLERLQNADGPDREIDATIAIDLLGFKYEKRRRDKNKWYYPPDSDSSFRSRYTLGRFQDAMQLPKYTASLDASIELVEKVLPGWVGSVPIGAGIASIYDFKKLVVEGLSQQFCSPGKTPALALLTALVQALIAEQE